MFRIVGSTAEIHVTARYGLQQHVSTILKKVGLILGLSVDVREPSASVHVCRWILCLFSDFLRFGPLILLVFDSLVFLVFGLLVPVILWLFNVLYLWLSDLLIFVP